MTSLTITEILKLSSSKEMSHKIDLSRIRANATVRIVLHVNRCVPVRNRRIGEIVQLEDDAASLLRERDGAIHPRAKAKRNFTSFVNSSDESGCIDGAGAHFAADFSYERVAESVQHGKSLRLSGVPRLGHQVTEEGGRTTRRE